ncbi:MAG: hypothetical protein NVSMB5_14480 [Candidatus Velthaea sp.]
MEQVQLSVMGMSCEGCAKGIVAALRFMPGVTNVEASYADGRVIVQYDAARIKPKDLCTEIEALDYKVIE